MSEPRTLLRAEQLVKTYASGRDDIHAVRDVSFALRQGEFLGIVGESGSGKSTLARLITLLEPPDSGAVSFRGAEITGLRGARARAVYRHIQMVFQTPQDSFNPRIPLDKAIVRHMVNLGADRQTARRRLDALLELVGLSEEHARRYPHEVSGGECQRAAIARAMAAEPDLIVFDEATSALDVSVQAQILHLIAGLKTTQGLSGLFICHDLSLVRILCERVVVLYGGQVVEMGETAAVLDDPVHPYTRLLLASVPPVDPDVPWDIPVSALGGAVQPPAAGCAFFHRCPHAAAQCSLEAPALTALSHGHSVACRERI